MKGKLFLFFLILSISKSSFSRKLDYIELKKGNITREKFYALKSDNSIKHGHYQLGTIKGIIVEDGYYKLGLKDSIWKTYYYDKTKSFIASTGNYKDGNKVGIWEYYFPNGNLDQKYDYTSNELIEYNYNDFDSTYSINPNLKKWNLELDSYPIYIGGRSLLKRDVQLNARYPKSALELGVSEKILISFEIDENGIASNFTPLNFTPFGFEKEALESVSKLSSTWIPGKLNGNSVKTVYIIPVNFQVKW